MKNITTDQLNKNNYLLIHILLIIVLAAGKIILKGI